MTKKSSFQGQKKGTSLCLSKVVSEKVKHVSTDALAKSTTASQLHHTSLLSTDEIWFFGFHSVCLHKSGWRENIIQGNKLTSDIPTPYKVMLQTCKAQERLHDYQGRRKWNPLLTVKSSCSAGTQRWSFPGTDGGAFTSYPPRAWWHCSHGFLYRQFHSRWFSMIGKWGLRHTIKTQACRH